MCVCVCVHTYKSSTSLTPDFLTELPLGGEGTDGWMSVGSMGGVSEVDEKRPRVSNRGILSSLPTEPSLLPLTSPN